MITNEEVLKEPKDLTLEIENDDELKRLNLNLNNNNIIKEQKNNKYEEIPFIYNEKKNYRNYSFNAISKYCFILYFIKIY